MRKIQREGEGCGQAGTSLTAGEQVGEGEFEVDVTTASQWVLRGRSPCHPFVGVVSDYTHKGHDFLMLASPFLDSHAPYIPPCAFSAGSLGN